MRSGWWTGLLLLAAIVAVLVIGALNREDDGEDRFGGTRPSSPLNARVVGVTDGDTIDVAIDGEVEHVRYIGIDTPESNPDQPQECFGKEASEANRELVEGETVELEFGPELRDRYGRLLAYVRVGGLFVNAELVEQGFARSLTIAPNDARAPLFRRLEEAAGRAGIGLWGACGT
jgi:micrococcal nuclease